MSACCRRSGLALLLSCICWMLRREILAQGRGLEGAPQAPAIRLSSFEKWWRLAASASRMKSRRVISMPS